MANALACGIEGSIKSAGDVDFYSLGATAPAGSRVFALVDGAAANANDFDLRITTATDTLEYDDDNNDIPFGVLSPNVAGTPLTGASAFIRVSQKSATVAAEPYRLYAVVQPPINSATTETEPNNIIAQANTATNNYFTGTLSTPAPSSDVDMYGFRTGAGGLVFLSLDEDPLRNNTPVNAVLALLDSNGVVLASVNDPASSSSTNSGAGSLTAANPSSPAEGLVYRVKAAGRYYARVSVGTNTTSAVGAGDYLLLISKLCRPGGNMQPAADNQNANVPSDVPSLLTLTGSDFEEDPLTFQITSFASHGRLSGLNPTTGEVVYMPAHGYSGADSFAFIVNDGMDNSATATVSIAVAAPPDSDGDGIPNYWALNFFNSTNVNASGDSDADGISNLQEYLAYTNPTDATSALRITSITRNAAGQAVLTWSSVGSTRYRVQYSNGDAKGSYNGVFTDIVRSAQIEIDPNPVGLKGTLSFTDDFTLSGGAPPSGARHYRIKVIR
jgi:hypothetical protein